MVIRLVDIGQISVGDTELVAIDYTAHLDDGELLTGAPTVVEQVTAHLTLTNKVVSTAPLVIKGRTAAIGTAVQFRVSGQQAATTYSIHVTVSTNATPARTFVREYLLESN